jgi:hypothetical protein
MSSYDEFAGLDRCPAPPCLPTNMQSHERGEGQDWPEETGEMNPAPELSKLEQEELNVVESVAR